MMKSDQSKITPNGILYPLISINALIDTDIGLYNLIKESFLNYSVFRRDFFAKPQKEIIRALYYRMADNPLAIMVNDNIPKNDIEDYYKQFFDQHKKEILNYSINTSLIDAVKLFIASKEIKPTILYYDNIEKEYLENHEFLKTIKKISLTELLQSTSNKNQMLIFTELYMKKVSEFTEELSKCKFDCISIYLSTYGPNFELDKENNLSLKFNEYMMNIVSKSFQDNISIIELYNNTMIGDNNN